MNFPVLFRKKSISQILKQSAAGETDVDHIPLAKHLGVRDLTAFGIAAIIGAGIFSTIGTASADGGPGVIFLFIFTAIACAFSAFCYAEFASSIPVAGSAYTYAYASLGEFLAWIIGWDLLMEYAIGNIAVAISWSTYFVNLVDNISIGSFSLHVPAYFTMDYFSAFKAHEQVQQLT